MERLQEFINPWVKELESAFAPYPEFVNSTLEQLKQVEAHQAELMLQLADAREALLKPVQTVPVAPAPEKDSEQMNAILTRFEQELVSARAVAESATQDVTTLKRELQFSESERSQANSELARLKSELSQSERTREQLLIQLEQATQNIDPLDSEIEGEERVRPAAARVRKVREKLSSKLPERRVLLIDDAEISRVLMSHYFKGMPVQLDFAPNLAQGLKFCVEKKYDLLIVDLELNGSDSVSLAQGLKGNVGEARIFAFSPNDFSADEERQALEAGFHSYFSRSLPKETIIDKLSQNLWFN